MLPVSVPQNVLPREISTHHNLTPTVPTSPETVSGRQMGTRSFWDRTPLPPSVFRVRFCYFGTSRRCTCIRVHVQT